MKYSRVLFFLFFLLGSYGLQAQNLPIGDLKEEEYRNAQLRGEMDSSLSFTVRPLLDEYLLTSAPSAGSRKSKSAFTILPFSWNQQFVSRQPFGFNDGAMIPASGFQSLVSGGFYFKYGMLSVQLKPEFVWAQNKNFPGLPPRYDDYTWAGFYTLYFNRIDAPERFGDRPYSRLSAGQSNVKLTAGPIALALSNENLWWGPGRQNSLLMSNTAPGFKHLRLTTVKPVATPIGSFEGQIIAARLATSGFLPPEPGRLLNGDSILINKEKDWRYLSGIVLTYHPKWIDGLFIGLDRSFYVYHAHLQPGLSKYLPFLSPFEKAKTGNTDSLEQDQLTSAFVRWVWRQAKAEIYFEYGRNDHSVTGRDFFLEPEHSNASTVGITKIIELGGQKGYVKAGVEITRLTQAFTYLLRGEPRWYSHYQVLDGYTNYGQVIGAGIGTGSNYHSFDVSLVKEKSTAGFQFELLEHNNDIYKDLFYQPGVDRRWIDYAYSFNAVKRYSSLSLNMHLKFIKSSNYEWDQESHPLNVAAGIVATYYFKQ